MRSIFFCQIKKLSTIVIFGEIQAHKDTWFNFLRLVSPHKSERISLYVTSRQGNTLFRLLILKCGYGCLIINFIHKKPHILITVHEISLSIHMHTYTIYQLSKLFMNYNFSCLVKSFIYLLSIAILTAWNGSTQIN